MRLRATAAIVVVALTTTLLVSIAGGVSTAAAPTPTLGVVMGGFDDPAGMAMDPSGTVWVANNQAGTVQPVPAGDILQSQLPAASTGLSYPADVATDSVGDVFVSEQGSTTVEEIPAGAGAPIVFHGFHQPAELAVDQSGNVWVANSAADTIQEIPEGSTAVSTLPTPIGGMNHPNGIVVDGSGNLWVANTGGSTIQEIPAGSTSASTLPTAIGGFSNPYGLAFDDAGNLWVTNSGNNTVQAVPAGATFKTALANPISGFNLPTDVTLAPNGDLWVSNTNGNTIQVLPETATSSTPLSSPIGGFNGPFGVVFTSTCSAWVSNVGQDFNGSGTSIQQVNTPLGCPSMPTGVIATPGNGQATISWDAATSPVADPVSGYSVESVPGGLTCGVAANFDPSCVVTGLTNGVAYTFDVVATNGLGDSGVAISPPATPSATLLAAPSLVSDSAGNRTARVRWAAPPSPPTLLYYVVSISAPGLSPQGAVVGPTSTSVTFSSLVNGAKYTLSIFGVDASGDGNTLSVHLSPATVPGPVRSLVAAAARSALTVSWKPPTNTGGSAITGYDVYLGTRASFVPTSPRNSQPLAPRTFRYVITGIKSKTRYFVIVRAISKIGIGSRSPVVSAIFH
jgi:streptogramin lyase